MACGDGAGLPCSGGRARQGVGTAIKGMQWYTLTHKSATKSPLSPQPRDRFEASGHYFVPQIISR